MVLVLKSPPAKAGDVRDAVLILGSGRPPGGGHGSPLQCSFLENRRGQGSLAGYGPWGHKESGRTERLAQLVKMDKQLDCKHYSTICVKK